MLISLLRSSLVLCLLCLGACQSAPIKTPEPEPVAESLDEGVESQNEFNEEELVIGVENDENTLSYLQPKIIHSPLSIKNNIWGRIRSGFKLDYEFENSRIDAQMPWFINNQAYLDRVNMRASRYLWHIVEEIEKRNMPAEIALLPVVESAFDPFAYSHARASGVWQFIAPTARFMGLRLDWWYDGRRDILASTDASLSLLQHLHDRLNNDWLLALAAYNSGEGNVRKAIAKNKRKGKPTDFWHLDLPLETRAYVPKLLALTRLYNNPEKYNVYILPIPDQSYFDVVETESQIDLAQAARLADIPIEELYLLNPAFNRWATSPLGPHYLLVPKENAEAFRVALKDFPPDRRIAWENYTVKSGDTLSTVADNYGTTSHDLMRVNKLKNNTIRVGSTLMIPVASASNYSLSAEERLEKSKNISRDAGDTEKLFHTVKKGDTLSSIAKRYGVSSKKLASWNGMAIRDTLQIEQTIIIWTKTHMMAPSSIPPESPDVQLMDSGSQSATNNFDTLEPNNKSQKASAGPLLLPERTGAPQEGSMVKSISYKVRKGDSLGKIAKKYQLSIKDIIDWNNIDPKKYLRQGQRLTLHVDVSEAQ